MHAYVSSHPTSSTLQRNVAFGSSQYLYANPKLNNKVQHEENKYAAATSSLQMHACKHVQEGESGIEEIAAVV